MRCISTMPLKLKEYPPVTAAIKNASRITTKPAINPKMVILTTKGFEYARSMAVLFLILKVGIFSIEWKNSIPNLACYQPKSRPYPIPILPKVSPAIPDKCK